MALDKSVYVCLALLISLFLAKDSELVIASHIKSHITDEDLLQFAENLEFLEAEWYLGGAFGKGLDSFAPQLVGGAPPPVGVKKAYLDPNVQGIITEFAYQQIGHLRAFNKTVGLIKKPLIDLSAKNFATLVNLAFNETLNPPFDPYKSSLAFMLATYAVPSIGLTGYVGMNPFLQGYSTKLLLAGLLGAKAGQDAVIRSYLYARAHEKVYPYNHTVMDFTEKISRLKNKLGNAGIKDEGLGVPYNLGAEKKTNSNILSDDSFSLSYRRSAAEILRIVYGTGKANESGLFYPKGANGKIARSYLKIHG